MFKTKASFLETSLFYVLKQVRKNGAVFARGKKLQTHINSPKGHIVFPKAAHQKALDKSPKECCSCQKVGPMKGVFTNPSNCKCLSTKEPTYISIITYEAALIIFVKLFVITQPDQDFLQRRTPEILKTMSF